MIPPPPQGYKLVSNKEIPIVPFGAMFYSSEWMLSLKVGDKPCDDFQYAIPSPITEPESQDELITKSQRELIATQFAVIEILEANLEKAESRFQARETELMEVIESQRQRLAEIRICFNQINHNLS